jgi:hypothetical protein
MICHISADVYAHWGDIPPIYRIYVDDCMLVERTFTWPSYQFYLKENLICDLEMGVHKLRIENCTESGSFELKNFQIDKSKTSTMKNGNNTEITFTVDSDLSPELSNLNRIQVQQEALRREQQMLMRQQQTY